MLQECFNQSQLPSPDEGLVSHGLCLRPNAEKEGQTCQSPRGGEEACGLA